MLECERQVQIVFHTLPNQQRKLKIFQNKYTPKFLVQQSQYKVKPLQRRPVINLTHPRSFSMNSENTSTLMGSHGTNLWRIRWIDDCASTYTLYSYPTDKPAKYYTQYNPNRNPNYNTTLADFFNQYRKSKRKRNLPREESTSFKNYKPLDLIFTGHNQLD